MSGAPEDAGADRGRFAYHGLDRVVHERARLGILCCLASSDVELTFGDLKEQCELTDGNLHRHLQALEEAGFVRRHKSGGGRGQTFVRFTGEGRERFLDYVDLLENIARESRSALRQQEAPGRGDWAVEGGSA